MFCCLCFPQSVPALVYVPSSYRIRGGCLAGGDGVEKLLFRILYSLLMMSSCRSPCVCVWLEGKLCCTDDFARLWRGCLGMH